MKKKISALFLISFFVLTALSAEPKKKLNKGGFYHEDGSYSYDSEEMTPENSVLVYFSTDGAGVGITFAQINPTKKPMLVRMKTEGFTGAYSIPPVEPGTSFVAIEGFQSTNGGYYLLNGHLNYSYKLDFQVPDKPGLYFAGILSESSVYTSLENYFSEMGNALVIGTVDVEKVEEHYYSYMKKTELESLKKLLKDYKGTAWESLINERMEELSK